MDRELERIPGALWNFSQPIADNMEEAVSGVKGQLAIKIYGDDLRTLEAKGDEIVNVLRSMRGIADLGLFRVIGQPNLEFEVDRKQAARYQINCLRRTGRHRNRRRRKSREPGICEGEQRYDLVARYQAPYRNTKEAIENIRLAGALRRAGLTGATMHGPGPRWRFGNLSRRKLALRGHQIQRAGPRSGQHR